MKTLKEIVQHSQTLEGLREKGENGDRDLTRAELERVAADEERTAIEVFDQILSLLGGNVKMAEREMVRMLRLPPHWRDELLCHNCGPVLVENADRDDCPWCAEFAEVLNG